MASEDHRAPVLAPSLLTPGDPPPVTVENRRGASPFLFIGDHAGNVIPSCLGTLGVSEADRRRHIAWDIGVAGLGAMLADAMDAVWIRQTYSRLVIDCNRREGAPDSIPPVSDATPVPGNADLTPAARALRFAELHEPYQRAIAAELDRRAAAGMPTVLVALHSFTPRLADGAARPWQVGVLHDAGDPTFARALLVELGRDASLVVGDNEPYRMDVIDYTIPRHAYPPRLPYAELEVRQDLIGDEAGQQRWATIFKDALRRARA